jgi:hypothetical protein
MFEKWVGDRFKDLPDGRAIFPPRGRDWPGHLVPDQETRTRIERWYMAIGAIAAVASLLPAHLISRRAAA